MIRTDRGRCTRRRETCLAALRAWPVVFALRGPGSQDLHRAALGVGVHGRVQRRPDSFLNEGFPRQHKVSRGGLGVCSGRISQRPSTGFQPPMPLLGHDGLGCCRERRTCCFAQTEFDERVDGRPALQLYVRGSSRLPFEHAPAVLSAPRGPSESAFVRGFTVGGKDTGRI